MEVRIQVHAPTAFPPKGIPILSYYEAGWAPEQVLGWKKEEDPIYVERRTPVLQVIVSPNNSGDDDYDDANNNNKSNEFRGEFFLRN